MDYSISHVTDHCPVAAHVPVEVNLGDDQWHLGRAADFAWGQGAGPAGEGRIQRFCVLMWLPNTWGDDSRFGAPRAPAARTRSTKRTNRARPTVAAHAA